jgi:glucokinase
MREAGGRVGYALGIDIGGTKCAVALGRREAERPVVVWKASFPTAEAGGPGPVLERLAGLADRALAESGIEASRIEGIGISCGGPLDSRRGLVLSPPNLAGWDEVPVSAFFQARYGVEARLQNDANACALAEWRYGAGRGASDMVFLTFGTGLGAGIILGGTLLDGASSMAGEVGHIRLAEFGPVGYGKEGSFEGFCSGGGIAQLARSMALEAFQACRDVGYCPGPDALPGVDAKAVAKAAFAGDALAAAVYARCGTYLGRGLAILVDILNPELIALGGIFPRCEPLLRPTMEAELERESLERSRSACRIVGAGLGEELGDLAALSIVFGKEEGD